MCSFRDYWYRVSNILSILFKCKKIMHQNNTLLVYMRGKGLIIYFKTIKFNEFC